MMAERILWDIRESDIAVDCNGEAPHIEGGKATFRTIGCNCNPSAGATCGGCADDSKTYEIGKSHIKWVYKEISERDQNIIMAAFEHGYSQGANDKAAGVDEDYTKASVEWAETAENNDGITEAMRLCFNEG
jgi:hypothetical protein